jgi:purine-binding chemotaxis protein CheW
LSLGHDALGLDDAGRQALLDARSAALARRGTAAEQAAALRSYLVCTCGPDRYGLAVEAVAHVMPARACTPVPGAPPALIGLAARSGRVVSVLDLAAALGRPRTEGTREGRGHFLILRGAGPAIALAVERVHGVARVAAPAGASGQPEAAADLDAAPGLGADAVSSYAAAEGAAEGGFVVIDLPRLLRRYLP